MKALSTFAIVFVLAGCAVPIPKNTNNKNSSSDRETIDWNEMLNLYMTKSGTSVGTVEGIYTVSGLVTRTGKGFLSSEEKEKVKDRKENYAKVAIIHDPMGTRREFAEVIISEAPGDGLAIAGEFSSLSSGNVMVYKHYDAREKTYESYTFTFDREKELLEGVRTETKGNATITYTLTYVKILPKAH